MGVVLAFCAPWSQGLGEGQPGCCPLSWKANGHSGKWSLLSSALACIYKFKKIRPLSGLIFFFLGHTSLTKYYFQGSATEREQNVLSFRSREHNPGHLLEDLQNIRRESTVRTKGREVPAPAGPPSTAIGLPSTRLRCCHGPQSQRPGEGGPLPLWGWGGHVGVRTIPHTRRG